MKDTQYFRITMLRSWSKMLSRIDLPANYTRIGEAAGAQECSLVVLVEQDPQVTTDDVSRSLRKALDDFPGWMKVEEVTEQEMRRIRQSKEDAAYLASLQRDFDDRR